MKNRLINRQLVVKAYTEVKMQRYKHLTLAVTKKGKAFLYNDADMPAIRARNPEIEQTFPLTSKIAVKGLQRDYQGKGRVEVIKTLNEALRLF